MGLISTFLYLLDNLMNKLPENVQNYRKKEEVPKHLILVPRKNKAFSGLCQWDESMTMTMDCDLVNGQGHIIGHMVSISLRTAQLPRLSLFSKFAVRKNSYLWARSPKTRKLYIVG